MTETKKPHLSAKEMTQWWMDLEEQWRKAFNEAFLNKGPVTDRPSKAELIDIFTTPAIRFAGPRAPYPNMSFELTNASGLKELIAVETLALIHHNVESIEAFSKLTNVNGLFIYDNQVTSLKGIENMKGLQTFHFHANQITSLAPLEGLTMLKDVYATDNQIEDLEGITEAHAENLEIFRVMPNKKLHRREMLRVENTYGIRCMQG